MSWTVIRPVNFIGFFLNWFLLGMICVAIVYLLKNKQKDRFIAFLLFWALVFFFPQSGILPINAFVAEHFIYLSSISFFILISYSLRKYLRKGLFIFSILVLSLFYGMLTFMRNSDWRDPAIFYKKIIEFSPDSFQAHNNLGQEYEYRHFFDQAIKEYKKALEIEPGLIEARSNLANIYFKLSKFKEAKEEYALVEKTAPVKKAGQLQNNIGSIYEVEGLYDQALARYKLALRLDPKLNFTHFNIAKIYIIKGKLDLAANEVLESLPEISSAAAKNSRYLEAITAYIKPLKDAQLAQVFYIDLGLQFASFNLMEASIASFKRVIELDPLYDDAHFNLGLALWKKGFVKEAVFEFKTTLKINPNHLKAKGFLSQIIYPVRDKTPKVSDGRLRQPVSNGVYKSN
jgi:protein O-mannosyl-transferase